MRIANNPRALAGQSSKPSRGTEISKTSAHSDLKPIKLWGNGGSNLPKVRILLEELGLLPYEVVPVAWADVKQLGYLAVNPNGRLPSIQDPNLGWKLWPRIMDHGPESWPRIYQYMPWDVHAYHNNPSAFVLSL
ncbi:hypothetical protein B0T24DRAFT_598103 [Lasiosphaeria ovina]|uniref:GST N-terminal domain-containing protein n=1 Tax=Lasiosphaeria ovina TaxID=92902 RepID=A0AAE0JW22_9PEZI|nr:hypothetical protein B0T24DRAFT_598103 [Lasiosphaeria ovina]